MLAKNAVIRHNIIHHPIYREGLVKQLARQKKSEPKKVRSTHLALGQAFVDSPKSLEFKGIVDGEIAEILRGDPATNREVDEGSVVQHRRRGRHYAP